MKEFKKKITKIGIDKIIMRMLIQPANIFFKDLPSRLSHTS